MSPAVHVGRAAVWILALCAFVPNYAVNNRSISQDVVILAAVRNDTDGIQLVSVASDSSNSVLTFNGQYIPQECGEDSFRCEDLQNFVVSREGMTQYAIFIPVVRAVLIIILQYDYNSSSFDLFANYTLAVPDGFSPIRFFFEIANHIYTTCINLEEGYLTVFELYFNFSSIQSSNFGPALAEDNQNIADISQISKFVYADLGEEFPDGVRYQILFLKGNYLEGFDPTTYQFVTGVNIENCRPVSEVKYIGSQTLLVYCNDSAVYVDLAHQAVHDRQPYDEGGYPYLCPNRKAEFFYHRNTSCLTYKWNVNQASFDCISIPSISRGSCFGVNSNIFVYSDAKSGAVNAIVVAEDGNATAITLSPDSQRVRVLNNQYVVISRREENVTVVVDSQANFSPIITARNLRPDLMTILSVEPSPIPQSSTTSLVTPRPTSTPTGVPPMATADSHIKEIIIPVVAVGVVILISAIAVYGCKLIRRRKHATDNLQLLRNELQPVSHPVPVVEEGQQGHSQVVPSAVDTRYVANDIQPTDSEYQTAFPESVDPVQSTDQEGQTLNSSQMVAI